MVQASRRTGLALPGCSTPLATGGQTAAPGWGQQRAFRWGLEPARRSGAHHPAALSATGRSGQCLLGGAGAAANAPQCACAVARQAASCRDGASWLRQGETSREAAREPCAPALEGRHAGHGCACPAAPSQAQFLISTSSTAAPGRRKSALARLEVCADTKRSVEAAAASCSLKVAFAPNSTTRTCAAQQA